MEDVLCQHVGSKTYFPGQMCNLEQRCLDFAHQLNNSIICVQGQTICQSFVEPYILSKLSFMGEIFGAEVLLLQLSAQLLGTKWVSLLGKHRTALSFSILSMLFNNGFCAICCLASTLAYVGLATCFQPFTTCFQPPPIARCVFMWAALEDMH